jgi:hypothetical protein
MASWYKRQGHHEGLLNISTAILQSRSEETKLLKEFLRKLDSRNPFMPSSSLKLEPLSALVPLETSPLQINVVPKDKETKSLPVVPGLVKLEKEDNVLAAAAHAGSLHEAGLQGAAFRYQVSLL